MTITAISKEFYQRQNNHDIYFVSWGKIESIFSIWVTWKFSECKEESELMFQNFSESEQEQSLKAWSRSGVEVLKMWLRSSLVCMHAVMLWCRKNNSCSAFPGCLLDGSMASTQRKDKRFIIDWHGKPCYVSIERLQSAVTLANFHQDTSPSRSASSSFASATFS